MSRRVFPKHRRSVQTRNIRLRPVLEILDDRVLLSVNPIVAENMLPGTPPAQWQITGDGDPTIQGFTTDISVNHGQTVYFKINDTALASYEIDIYRMGYYGGLGAREVATIPPSQTTDTVQPTPDYDPSTGLIDCGNWSVSASWAIPAAATSGIYFANLVREDTGGRARSSSSSGLTKAIPRSCSRPPTKRGRLTTIGAAIASITATSRGLRLTAPTQ